MPTDLTPKQQWLLKYLRRALMNVGRVPSLREIAADLGVSHTAVDQLFKSLESKGLVRREGRYSRTVHLLDPAGEVLAQHRWRELPIVGRITAGAPMYAQQEWDGTVVVDAKVYTGRNLFALRVRGDSMRDAGILDGDLTICRPRQYARNGEIVVALIGGEEATVKRFFLREDAIELRPENPRFQPIQYDFDDVLVQGKVVGVIREPQGIAHRTD